MKKILFVNQQQLKDPAITNWLTANYKNYDWNNFFNIQKLFPAISSLYIRAGNNFLPFQNNLNDHIDLTMPRLEKFITYDLATDLRCQQLRQTHWNRPWIIMWSGGVDSTTIITSLLKNLSPVDFKNIYIACNSVSVYEYPLFYYNYIKPNFQIIDSSLFTVTNHDLNNYYVMYGEPNDHLFVAGWGQKISQLNNTVFPKDLNLVKEDILKMLDVDNTSEFSTWFYKNTINNAKSFGIKLSTGYDFFWWISINFRWNEILLRGIEFLENQDKDSIRNYFHNFINWFNTTEYQQWSLDSTAKQKTDFTLPGFKAPAKQYIYEYTKDEYYRKYKTKGVSTSFFKKSLTHNWFCMLDDYSTLTLSRDLDQILELLPAHIDPTVVNQ
jgi:hypothetical protein